MFSIYKEESKVNQPTVVIYFTDDLCFRGYLRALRTYASISSTTPSSTRNHLIFGSDSLNQFACLRTKTRVIRRISAFACSSVNSALMARTPSRYPIAVMVGREGE